MTGEPRVKRPFQIYVLNPAGCPDPALAIAACRAGAIGVFNAEMPTAAEGLADGSTPLPGPPQGGSG